MADLGATSAAAAASDTPDTAMDTLTAAEQAEQTLLAFPDIFGGSDLSDVESEDDEPPQRAGYASSDLASSVDSSEDDDDDDEDDLARGGDGVYLAEQDAKPVKKSKSIKGPIDKKKKGDEGKSTQAKYKIPKKAKRAQEDGQHLDEEGEPIQKKRPKMKKAAKAEEDGSEEERQLSPDATRRKNLKDRIDELVKKPKSKTAGGKKKRGDDDDLGQMNDDVVIDLRKRMIDAALADTKANDEGRPAIEKVKLLSEVVEMMQKASMAESLIENGILDAVTKWLEPLGDKSLPALIVQRSLFDILLNINIETFSLKASGLGKIVYFYTKVKGIDPPISRAANQLVINWMRPIIGRSKDFFDREISSNPRPLVKRKEMKKLGEGAAEESGIARRHARVPDAMTETFTVSPDMDIAAARSRGGGMQNNSNLGTSVKMKEYKKKLVAGQAASRRV